jgi:hypothetical protein
MLTQAMPALAQALSGVLPDTAVRQLMQALGNCQQSLSHRGSVSLDPVQSTGKNGLRRAGAWNPADYTRLLPNTGYDLPWRTVDIPRGSMGYPQMTNNYGGPGLDLPIDNAFATNNYYGGPTFNVGGNSNFDNSTHQNINVANGYVNNLRVQTINNQPIGDLGGGGGDGTGSGTPFFAGSSTSSNFATGVLPPGRIAYQKILTGTRGKYLPIKVPQVDTVTVPAAGIKITDAGFTYTDEKYPIVMNQSFTVPTTSSAYVPSFQPTGTVSVPTYSNFTLSNVAATVTGGSVLVPTTGVLSNLKMDFSGTAQVPTAGTLSNLALTFSGNVPVPTVGTLSKLTLGFSGSAQVPTKGTLANVTLSGNVPLKIPTAANLDNLYISTNVTVPSAWSAKFTAYNNVTIPVIQSAALDQNCDLQITWNNQVVSIPTAVSVSASANTSSSLLGAPLNTTVARPPLVFPALDTDYTVNAQVSSYGDITLGTDATRTVTGAVNVTDYGTVALGTNVNQAVTGTVGVSNYGTIALGADATRTVTGAVSVNSTSTLTLGGLTASSLSGASVSFTNSGKIGYDTSSTSQNFTLTTGNQPVVLGSSDYTVNLSMSNTLTVPKATGATLPGSSALDVTQKTTELQIDLESRFSNAVLIYYRPRF